MKSRLSAGLLLVLVTLLVQAAFAHAEVSVPALFSDHMILQRGQSVPVWEPQEPIKIGLKLDEPYWVKAREWSVGRFRDLQTGGRPIFGTTVMAGWDRNGQNVYFGIRCEERPGKKLNITATKHDEALKVLDLVNADKPFSQFVSEQIAGDLLPFDSHQQRDQRLVATGFTMWLADPDMQNPMFNFREPDEPWSPGKDAKPAEPIDGEDFNQTGSGKDFRIPTWRAETYKMGVFPYEGIYIREDHCVNPMPGSISKLPRESER